MNMEIVPCEWLDNQLINDSISLLSTVQDSTKSQLLGWLDNPAAYQLSSGLNERDTLLSATGTALKRLARSWYTNRAIQLFNLTDELGGFNLRC